MTTFAFTVVPDPVARGRAAGNRADPLGFDAKLDRDLDPSGRNATGAELAEAEILHRLEENSLLMTGAPNDEIPYGEDVTLWREEALSQEAVEAKAPRVEIALRRSPRFADVVVTATYRRATDPSGIDFFLAIHATLVTGEVIDRVVVVAGVTVEFLAQGT